MESTLPIAKWLPAYERSWIRPDVLAGVTVAAAVIPRSLAYTSLAVLPPQMGLYAVLLVTVVYVFFAPSRQ